MAKERTRAKKIMNKTPEFPDLPLVRIFHELDYKDQRSCAKVCWKWRNLIDRHFGKVMCVGKGNKEIWGDRVRYFQDIQIISTIGISECIVGGEIGEDIPNFKYPHLVKSIDFDGLLSAEKFNHLVKDLSNLRELKLHEGLMNNAFGTGTISLRFEKLKSFELVYVQLRSRPDKNTVKNIIGFLDGIFSPRLEVLILHSPCFPEMELYLLGYLFKCIARHKLSLNTLELKFLNKDIQFEEEAFFSGLFSVLGPLPSPVELSDFQHLNIRVIDINSAEYDGTEIIDYLKKHLFSHLTTLRSYKSIQYYHPYFSFPTQMILNNSNTLVSINLNCVGEVDSLIDCSVLSQCSSLKCLALATGYRIYKSVLQNYDPGRVIGLKSLPKSLEFIQLTFIMTTRENLSSLALELPNLKSLLLVDTVDEFGGILGATVLVESLMRKQIMQIIVHNKGMDVPKDWISTLKCSVKSQPFIKNILEDIIKYDECFIALHLEDGNYKMGLPKKNIFASMGAAAPYQDYAQQPAYTNGVWHKLISAIKRVRNRVYQFFGFTLYE